MEGEVEEGGEEEVEEVAVAEVKAEVETGSKEEDMIWVPFFLSWKEEADRQIRKVLVASTSVLVIMPFMFIGRIFEKK